MKRLHHHLCKKSPLYHKWHQHPLHRHVHWGLLGAVVLGVALSFVMLGWSETEVASVRVARAQSATISINGNTQYQTIDGWGVYANVSTVTDGTLDLLADLNINIIRIAAPAGADASNNYDITQQCAPDGAGGDFCRHEMRVDFRFLDGLYSRMRQKGLPVHLLISPWTPPARMKTAKENKSPLACGYIINTDQNHQEYANWAANVAKKFKERYPESNMTITWSIQNEPDYGDCGQWQPITPVSAVQVHDLANATRATLNTLGLGAVYVAAAEDYGAWHGDSTSGYLSASGSIIDRYVYHQYNLVKPNQWAEVKAWQENTGKSVWQTEFSWFGDYVTDDNPGGLDLAETMHEAIVEGNTTSYIYWGGATDGTGIPGQRLIRNDTATPNDKYYGFKRFSRNIPSGSRRVEATSNSGNIFVSAYRHPNGTFTIVVINKGGAQNVSFQINGISVSSLNRYRYTKGGNRDETLLSVDSTSGSFNDSVPGSSVTTYTTDSSSGGTPSCIPSTEICDQKDNDCDTQIDEGGVCGQPLTCDQIGSNAFAACFYNNQTLSGNPVLTRTDNQINFDWGTGSPATGVNIDNFSTRWQGNFTFDAANYDFTVVTDDGFRLFLDNTLILDQWKDQAPTAYTVTRTLTAGTHLLKVEFYENGGEAVAKLSWQKKTAACVPTTEICDGKDNDCDTQIDEGNVCGTTNQPPRNLLLRYLGPTPTGGNLCGNGTINTNEQCDGTNLNGQTCQSLGFQSGTPVCYPAGSANQCTFNTSGCTSGTQCTPSCGAWSDPANQCGSRTCTRTDCSTYSDTKSCGTTYDPRQGHTYPRLSAFTWGGAVPWYYAQLDLIDTGNSNPAFAQAIKAINPNTRVVVTKDIQAGFSEAPLPQEWRARASRDYNGDGKPDFCVIYGGSQASGPYYYDITDAAPVSAMPQTNCGTYCGQRYNQYIDDLYRQTVDLSVFDGVATDGLWDRYSGGAPCDSDIDLDRNGQNDYSERGKQGVDGQIAAGALKMIQGMRAGAGPNKLVIVNSGGPHTYGMQDSNGFIHEHFIGHFGFDWNKGVYENWMANAVQPVTPIVNTDTVGGSLITPNRNDFPLMRYGLTFALVTGSYFDFTDYDRAGEHYWVKYYDEYDTDLGYPLGPAQKTPSGAWVRFFDNGMAITNGSDTDTVTVRVSEVRGMTGYNPGNTGFYRRFRGGQDIAINGTNAMNNGDPFDDTHPIVLKNRQQLGRDAQGELHPAQADGIILLREPAAVVSDIIIDNWNSGTSPGSRSPGSDEADTMGGFTQANNCDTIGSSYFTVRCNIYLQPNGQPNTVYHSPPFASALAGSNAQAVYTPNIGVAGQYRIYEWHGRLSSGTLASNVRYVIDAVPVAAASNCTTTGVSATCTVNQQTNTGRWNSLGTYRFTTSGGENVSILASGANGTVMADAVMFRYVGP